MGVGAVQVEQRVCESTLTHHCAGDPRGGALEIGSKMPKNGDVSSLDSAYVDLLHHPNSASVL